MLDLGVSSKVYTAVRKVEMKHTDHDDNLRVGAVARRAGLSPDTVRY